MINITPAQMSGLLHELASIANLVHSRLTILADDFAGYAQVATIAEEMDGVVVSSVVTLKPTIAPTPPKPVPDIAGEIDDAVLIDAFKRTAKRVGPEKAKALLSTLGVERVSLIPQDRRIEAVEALGAM